MIATVLMTFPLAFAVTLSAFALLRGENPRAGTAEYSV
jgi:hypothetical protein